LETVVSSRFKFDFPERVECRPLGHVVNQAAGAGLSVKYRSWPARHFNAFRAIGLQAVAYRESRIAEFEAVSVKSGFRRIEAANFDEGGARLKTERLALHAGRVAQGFGHGADILRFHLIAGNHRDRLGRFYQRSVGFGADRRAAGFVIAGFIIARRFNLYGWQGDFFFFGSLCFGRLVGGHRHAIQRGSQRQ